MMFKETLARVGINKGALVGILFMIIVLGILVGVKMVRGVGNNIELFYTSGVNTLTSDSSVDGNVPVTPENAATFLKTASNTNEFLDNNLISSDLANSFAKNDPSGYANKMMESGTNDQKVKRLTYTPEIKNQIQSLNSDIWNKVREDNAVSKGVLEQLDYKISGNPAQMDFSKSFFDDKGFHYGKDPAIILKNVPVNLGSVNNPMAVSPAPGVTSTGASYLGNMPGGSSSGSPGGSSPGGAENDMKKLDEAFQKAAGTLGTLSSLGIKADNFKQQANAPVLFVPTGSTGEVSLEEGKQAVLVDDKGKSVVVSGQAGGSKYSWNGQGVSILKTINGNSWGFVNGKVVAQTVTSAEETSVTLNANSDNPAPANTGTSSNSRTSSNTISKFILPFFRLIGFVNAEESINGNAIVESPNQFIEFVEYNLKIGGRNNDVIMLKPFDKVNAKGSELSVISGNVVIDFKNMKTYYPRTVNTSDFFINEIRNDYDTKNVYMLVPGGSKGNYFEDERQRLTVGDSIVKNPVEDYENISIPATRLSMWKKAVEGDIIN